ncbi:unnamed protein product [Spirodela intermedia]|uniref:Uncharacterized protein n=1 Tax=Spirodela intermedia TaxID=51605 RepID=A0A7I8KBA3_SPIIN|nr:unnamed protein product [Spirodela intermedia]
MTTTKVTTTATTTSVAHLLRLKLLKSNYLMWKTQFLPLLRSQGLSPIVDLRHCQPDPPGNFIVNPKYEAWYKNGRMVFSWIVSSLKKSVFPTIVDLHTAKSAWHAFARAYASGNPIKIA